MDRQEKGTWIDEILMKEYKGRDIVSQIPLSCFSTLTLYQKFLVDNAESMDSHWFEVQFLLETLVLKARDINKDGMDLTFTCSPSIKVERSNKPLDFTQAMKDLRSQPRSGSRTSMQKALGKIFGEYLSLYDPTVPKSRSLSLFKSGKKRAEIKSEVKNVTLVVFTDGIWARVEKKKVVDQAIIDFVRNLQEKSGKRLRDRGFSIQFIQFGDDLAATAMLEHLDDELKPEGIPYVNPPPDAQYFLAS